MEANKPKTKANTDNLFAGLIIYFAFADKIKDFFINLAKAVLVDSGRPVETTGEMVAAVRRKLETRNSKLKP